MNTLDSKEEVQSILRLSFRYSTYHRRLSAYILGLSVVETIWFAYAGYVLRNVPALANRSQSYSILSKCAGSACSNTFGPSQTIVNSITTLLIYLLPLVFAVVLVGPSLAKEFETKSVRFFWTQGISRNQWLASRLIPGLIGALSVVIVGQIELQRWIFPHNLFDYYDPWRMFAFRGVVPVAIAFSLVAISVFSSIVLKRSLLVVLVTALTFGAIVFAISFTEPILIAPKTVVYAVNWGDGFNQAAPFPQNSQFVTQAYLSKDGAQVPNAYITSAFDSCSARASNATKGSNGVASGNPFNQRTFSKCMTAYDFYLKISYQPYSRYGDLQWIYTAMAVITSSVFVGLSFFLLKRVDL